MSDVLKEAKRLHELGFAVHWLHPRSKRPVQIKDWQKGPRKSWEELRRTYRDGYNVGVRLGRASRFEPSASGRGPSYLCVLDCDVKSGNSRAVAEMERTLKTLIGQLSMESSAATVLSGRGNGSKHIYFRSKVPVARGAVLAHSKEKMDLNGRKVWKWEIALMGERQQVVLPPSVHPDTGKRYRWSAGTAVSASTDLPWLPKGIARTSSTASPADVKTKWTYRPVDLMSDTRVPDELADKILRGEGVADRSAALFSVARALLRCGLCEDEVLTVLSDRESHLGRAAYDHTGSSSRNRAVRWLRRYTTAKSEASEREVLSGFEAIPAETPLSFKDAKKQRRELLPEITEENWRMRIERQGKEGNGPPKHTVENIVLILSRGIAMNLVKRDLFAMRDSWGADTPWGSKGGTIVTDTDVNLIRLWLAEHYRFEPAAGHVHDALDVLAERNGFHPIRQFLRSLPAWDGEARLNRWLKDHLGAEGPDEYLGQVFRKWMVGAVTRIFHPGTQFDWMPIFEGPQGIGKSTFLRNLVSGEYFADWLPDLKDKDAALAVQGNWIVEMGELADLRKNEIDTVKAFISRRLDKFRPPYGRKQIEAPRQCVFAGTTNREAYLRDDTGNRRFVPVKLSRQLDWNANKRAVPQLWAEALSIYDLGLEATFDLEGDAKDFARVTQAKKMVTDDADMYREELLVWMRKEMKKPEEQRADLARVRIPELFDDEVGGPLQKHRQTNIAMQFVAKALKQLGGERRMSKGLTYWTLPTPPTTPLPTKKQPV